eukprot:1182768-Prorocentrum_minimum.AAC.2
MMLTGSHSVCKTDGKTWGSGVASRALTEMQPDVAPVVVLRQTQNTLLNRYMHYAHVRTDSVFLTDDDITLCEEVRGTHTHTHTHTPETPVTFQVPNDTRASELRGSTPPAKHTTGCNTPGAMTLTCELLVRMSLLTRTPLVCSRR